MMSVISGHVSSNITDSKFIVNCSNKISHVLQSLIFMANAFFCPACVSSKALGMESGKIPNQAINASSFLNNNHKPSYGRLNINKHHCSWTPKLKEKNAWLHIDFGQLTTVKA